VHEKPLSFIRKINYDSWNSNSTIRTEVAALATSAACFAGSDESLQFLILGTALLGKCKRFGSNKTTPKCPAGATVCLILHITHDPFCPPVFLHI
jgi:hypothetical protein